MAYPKKIVLNCPHGASSTLTPLVEEFIRDGVMFVGVVGKDCSLVEDLIDKIVVGDGTRAIPDLEAAIRPLRLNRRKKLQDDVDFRKPRSSFRYQADEAGSSKETANS